MKNFLNWKNIVLLAIILLAKPLFAIKKKSNCLCSFLFPYFSGQLLNGFGRGGYTPLGDNEQKKDKKQRKKSSCLRNLFKKKQAIFFVEPSQETLLQEDSFLDKKTDSIKDSKLTKEEFLKTAKQYVKVFKKKMQNNNFVLDKKTCGFVMSAEIPDQADVKIFTDLHSSDDALQKFNVLMRDNKWVGTGPNKWKLLNKNKYLVFLGDYIDRGKRGVYVLYNVWKYFINNPDNVVLLRGNHEDEAMYESYGFLGKEIERSGFEDLSKGELKKFGIDYYADWFKYKISVLDLDVCLKKSWSARSKDGAVIKEALDNKPNAFYLFQKNNDKKTRCYLFTHGGVAFNFFPKKPCKLSKVIFQAISKKAVYSFAWNDFIKNKKYRHVAVTARSGSSIEFGKDFFVDYAKEFEKKTGAKMVQVVRGHQHEDLYRELKRAKGLYFLHEIKQWDGNSSNAISIKKLVKKEPAVITLGCFSFKENKKATVVGLDLKKSFDECKIVAQIIKK
ncbi:metallophosphoesterase [bacterium]|nr:metallophosphoesterase [bacterium]